MKKNESINSSQLLSLIRHESTVCVRMQPYYGWRGTSITIVGWGDFGYDLLNALVCPVELRYLYETDEFNNKFITREVFPEIGENSTKWRDISGEETDLLIVVANLDDTARISKMKSVFGRITQNAKLSIGVFNFGEKDNLSDAVEESKRVFDNVMFDHQPLIRSTQDIRIDRCFLLTRALIDMITTKGMVGFDFSDIALLMKSGKFLSIGQALAKDNLVDAAKMAITTSWNPRLAFGDAKGVIVLIRADSSVSIIEAHSAAEHIQKRLSPDADVLFTVLNDNTKGRAFEVTVIANYAESGFKSLLQYYQFGSHAKLDRFFNQSVSPRN